MSFSANSQCRSRLLYYRLPNISSNLDLLDCKVHFAESHVEMAVATLLYRPNWLKCSRLCLLTCHLTLKPSWAHHITGRSHSLASYHQCREKDHFVGQTWLPIIRLLSFPPVDSGPSVLLLKIFSVSADVADAAASMLLGAFSPVRIWWIKSLGIFLQPSDSVLLAFTSY